MAFQTYFELRLKHLLHIEAENVIFPFFIIS